MGTLLVTFNSVCVLAIYNKMSATNNPNVNTFNKSKEDFIWFVKKATTDKKSYSHSELYHSLLKMFVDADTNKDGLVSRASFSNLIDEARWRGRSTWSCIGTCWRSSLSTTPTRTASSSRPSSPR